MGEKEYGALKVFKKTRAIRSVDAKFKTVWYLTSSASPLKIPPILNPGPADIHLHLNTKKSEVTVWVFYPKKHIKWEDVTESYFAQTGDIIHPELTPPRVLSLRGQTNDPTWIRKASLARKVQEV